MCAWEDEFLRRVTEARKEEVKELEAEERKDETRLNEKLAENKRLSAPLKRMQEDVVRLRAELKSPTSGRKITPACNSIGSLSSIVVITSSRSGCMCFGGWERGS